MKLIIRSDNKGGIELLGRSMKPITNRWLHEKFTEVFAEFLQLKHFVFEGELQAGNSFEKCDGLLSALYREFDDVVFHIFDEISDASLPYSTRYQYAALAVKMLDNPMVQLVNNFPIKDMESLLAFHMMNEVNPALDGTIVRQMEMEYKAGKRTVNEGYVVKIKNEDDAEAEIIGIRTRRCTMATKATQIRLAEQKDHLLKQEKLGLIHLAGLIAFSAALLVLLSSA